MLASLTSSRIGLKELSALCRRLATSLDAGLPIKLVFEREASGRGSRGLRKHMSQIYREILEGQTLADALEQTGDYFPPLFRELLELGEESGKLNNVLKQLADNYEYQLKVRRDFISSLTWPAFQLTIAIFVIGGMIWIMGMISNFSGQGGKPIDILGFGLIGNKGLLIYSLIVGSVAALVAFFVHALSRGVLWVKPMQRFLLKVPTLGGCLQTFALARLAWTFHLTTESGMDLRRAIPLSLRSTRNARYTDGVEDVVRKVLAGGEISRAFVETGAYPRDFLDALEVGEESGRMPETMAHLAVDYQDRARRSMSILANIAGFGVWLLVAFLIILMIFRIFSFYLGALKSAM